MRSTNWSCCCEKLYMPPYCSTMAQMLRTPRPWPGWLVVGMPSAQNCTGKLQEFAICKNSLPSFW